MPKIFSRGAKKPTSSPRHDRVDPKRMMGGTTPSREFTRFCPKCGSVYYDKKWYSEEELARHIEHKLKGQSFDQWFRETMKSAKETICEADKQGKNWSEGVVVLSGLRPGLREQVMGLVKNVDREGRKNDVEDKIVAIEDHGEEVTIYTSENQLAHRIGKQVHSAFKGGKLEIKFSDREEATRVYWQAPER